MLEKRFCMVTQNSELSNFMAPQKLSNEKEDIPSVIFMLGKL